MSKQKRLFDSDETGKSLEFLNYLKTLSADQYPFECPFLRILPEDVTIRRYSGGPPNRYMEGDLMCIGKTEKGLSGRCRDLHQYRINEEGDLEAMCQWPLKGSIVLHLFKK